MTDQNQNYQPWTSSQGPHRQGPQPDENPYLSQDQYRQQPQQSDQYPPGSYPQGGYQQNQYPQGNQTPNPQQGQHQPGPYPQGGYQQNQYPQGNQTPNPQQGQYQQSPMGGWSGTAHPAAHGSSPAGMNSTAVPGTRIPVNSRGWVTYAGIGGALLAIVGSFGPWATTGGLVSTAIAGTAGDGKFSLFFALVGCAMLTANLFVQGRINSFAPPAAAGAGVLTLLIGMITTVNLGSAISNTSSLIGGSGLVSLSVGWGLIAVILGGALLTASGVLLFRARK